MSEIIQITLLALIVFALIAPRLLRALLVQRDWFDRFFSEKLKNERLKLETEKKRLKNVILQLVENEPKLDQLCAIAISKELNRMALESTVNLEISREDGSIWKVRMPTTFWDVLRWRTLRNDPMFSEDMQIIELACSSNRLQHSYSTRQRIEALFQYTYKASEVRKTAEDQLNERTLTEHASLAIELGKYGVMLSNYEPREPMPPAVVPTLAEKQAAT